MAFLKKSLSEDSADHYSNTWAFLLLFLLSIITLFVPLSPSIELNKITIIHGQSNSESAEDNVHLEPPHYKASCWTPAQFTGSHVMYVNGVCGAALNSLIRRRNFSDAHLYDIASDEIPIGPMSDLRPLGVEDFLQTIESTEDSDKETNQQSLYKKNAEEEEFQARLEILQHDKEKAHSGIRELVFFKTPLYLFLLAICLRLPHAIWSLLSNCCGCINVNQTLASAQTLLAMDNSSRQKLRENLGVSLGKSNRKGTSLIYLLMKLLMVVVVCVEVIVVSHCLLVESDKLENDLDTVRVMNEALAGEFTEIENSHKTGNGHHVTAQKTNYTDSIYTCELKIRQFQTLQSFSLQCLFRIDDGKAAAENIMENGKDDRKGSRPLRNNASDSNDKLLLMYKGLYTIVLAMLIILVFLNISSLVAWLLKLLLSSCRSSLGLKADAAMDFVFLVSMAWNNTNAVLAKDLAEHSPWSETDGQEGESYKLKNSEGLSDE